MLTHDLSLLKADLPLLLETLSIDTLQKKQHCPCRFCGSSDALSVYQKDSGWAYRCFSCNDHGDVLNALMKVKNISFKEAMTQCGSDFSNVPPATLKKIPREIKAGGRWQPPAVPEPMTVPEPMVLPIPTPNKNTLWNYLGQCLIPVLDTDSLFLKYANERGLDRLTCGRLGVGFDLKRRCWVLPILHNDQLVALKTHRGGADVSGQKSGWFKGGPSPPYGLSTFFPLPECFPALQPLYLCEGELKALRFICEGYAATSPTSGAGFHWTPAQIKHFTGRTVYILYDNDPAGRRFKDHAIQALAGGVVSLKVGTFQLTATANG